MTSVAAFSEWVWAFCDKRNLGDGQGGLSRPSSKAFPGSPIQLFSASSGIGFRTNDLRACYDIIVDRGGHRIFIENGVRRFAGQHHSRLAAAFGWRVRWLHGQALINLPLHCVVAHCEQAEVLGQFFGEG